MNLEDFFISEYEKLRRENELLKEENANLNRRILKIPKPVETAGLIDARIVGTDVEAVKVIFASSYALQNAYRGKPTSWLEEKKADVGNALEWPEDEYPCSCDNGFECDVCGNKVEDYEHYAITGKFEHCPGCGRMVVE